MANFTPRQPDLEDDRGKWFKTADGRMKITVQENNFGTNTVFKEDVLNACNNRFPKGGNQNGFPSENKTYSISEYMGKVSVYEGEAKYPTDKVIEFPKNYTQEKKQYGGGGFNKKPYTPPKQVVPNVVSNPKALPLVEAMKDCADNPTRKFFGSIEATNDDGFRVYVTGELTIVE